MRKKLLRSRSGFEKPESREEAIMQNILGASNVLEPSESNIEEILKSILYNTPYTEEAEFEIEKILLAIKNNGTYDGECESRDLKILFAILNDLDYTEEAESRIEELFIEWLHQRSSIKVLEGIPPLTFTSRGLPLINYLIEGNTVQTGTPTPDSPIMPQGTGERTGNLCPATDWEYGQYVTGVWEYTSGRMTSPWIPIEGGSAYYLSINDNGSNLLSWINLNYFDENKQWLGNRVTLGMDAFSPTSHFIPTPAFPNDAKYLRVVIRGYNESATPTPQKIIDSNIQVNKTAVHLSYEPYGIKIPISSASTTTPVYLGEVQSTRRIKKLVLDGTENRWNKSGAYQGSFYLAGGAADAVSLSYQAYCSHATFTTLDQYTRNTFCFNGSPINLNLWIGESSWTTDDFKAYLQQQYAAGTPVTVWYVLANEETGIVNEPLRKIGDYADTLSMEQAGVEIPTNNGSTTLDVGTTVKPSNVYIEYK